MGKGKSKRKRKESQKANDGAPEHQARNSQPPKQSPIAFGVNRLEERDTGQGAEKSQEKRRWRKRKPPIPGAWLRFAEVLFALAIVILTVGLFFATAWQTYAMVEQNRIMREQNTINREANEAARVAAADSAKAAQKAANDAAYESFRTQQFINDTSIKLLRAYVSVQPLQVVDAKQPDKLKVSVNIANKGQTRAHSLTVSMGWQIAPLAYAGRFDRDRRSDIRSWLGPSDEMSLPLFIDVTPSQRESMKAGKDVLWVYGRAEYRDEYGEHRCTQYRSYYDWQEESFVYADEGNEADKCFPDSTDKPTLAPDEPPPPEYQPPEYPPTPPPIGFERKEAGRARGAGHFALATGC